MKTTILAVIAIAIAGSAAYAQPFGFNGTTQQFGNQRYFNGTTPDGQGYTGNSQTLGDQTYSHFYSGGSSLNCTASHVGQTTYTNCY